MTRANLLELAERCETCRWFHIQADYPTGGHCWRYPPIPSFQAALDGSGNIHFENLRPYTGVDESCGEHSLRAIAGDET